MLTGSDRAERDDAWEHQPATSISATRRQVYLTGGDYTAILFFLRLVFRIDTSPLSLLDQQRLSCRRLYLASTPTSPLSPLEQQRPPCRHLFVKSNTYGLLSASLGFIVPRSVIRDRHQASRTSFVITSGARLPRSHSTLPPPSLLVSKPQQTRYRLQQCPRSSHAGTRAIPVPSPPSGRKISRPTKAPGDHTGFATRDAHETHRSRNLTSGCRHRTPTWRPADQPQQPQLRRNLDRPRAAENARAHP